MSVRFFPKDTVQVKLYENMTMYHYSNLKKLFFLKNKGPEMISVIDQKKTIAPHIKNILYPSLTEALILSKNIKLNWLKKK